MVNPLLVALGAAAFVAGAEALHARRARRARRLAFGGAGRPRAWVRATPLARCIGVVALAWGLVTLFLVDGGSRTADPRGQPARRLLLCLDVSPSMRLPDSGAERTQPRADRASALVRSMLERLDMTTTRVSVVAFYTGARPVVVDAYDLNVVANILNDLPLEHAFKPGPTDMYSGVRQAFEIARAWPARSAALVVVSDGDTIPDTAAPNKPASIADVLVVGVGNPRHGKPIAGRTSRQDARSLERLALRLGGVYHDGNEKHLSSASLASLAMRAPPGESERGMRDVALAAVGVGGAMVSLVSPALAVFGMPGASSLRVRTRRDPPLAQGVLT